MKAPLEIRVERDDAAARVIVVGELDLATAGRLRDALNGELDSALPALVDLKDCTFMDSVGLSVLVEAAQRTERSGAAPIALISPSAAVQRLIDLTQLDSMIPVFGSEAEAARRLAPSEAVTE